MWELLEKIWSTVLPNLAPLSQNIELLIGIIGTKIPKKKIMIPILEVPIICQFYNIVQFMYTCYSKPSTPASRLHKSANVFVLTRTKYSIGGKEVPLYGVTIQFDSSVYCVPKRIRITFILRLIIPVTELSGGNVFFFENLQFTAFAA